MAANEGDIFLIEAVQAGDQSAWHDVIDRYEGRLLSFARRRLANKDVAEDIVQETFLGLMRSLPNYDKTRSLETYLFAILRNKLTDHFRKADRGVRESLDALDVSDTPDSWLDSETPSRYAANQEGVAAQRSALVDTLRQWVESCLKNARFQDLIVVEMLVVLGLRNKEVAGDLDLTETGVAGIKFRVVDQWKKLTQTGNISHAWAEGDLAQNSTIGSIWREEGISCLKRSTLGRYLLGVLDDDLNEYIDFHIDKLGCERCAANLDDLRHEDEQDNEDVQQRREKLFTSSIGFLSKRPE